MNRTALRFWLVLSCLGAVGMAPLVVGSNPEQVKLRQRHHHEMAKLTETERARLQENYESFQRLSKADQQRLTDFHRLLEVDQQEKEGRLNSAMESYLSWLRSIPPYQREALQQATDAQARLKLIREYVASNRQTRAEQTTFRESQWLPPRARQMFAGAPLLSSEQLADFMSSIEKSNLVNFLSNAQMDELRQLQGIERYVKLLTFLKDRDVSGNWWSAPPLRNLLMREMQNTPVAEFLKEVQSESASQETPDFLARAAGMFILMTSLIREANNQQGDMELPSDQALQRVLAELPEAERDQLLSLDTVDFRNRLIALYRQQQTPVQPREIVELFLPPQGQRDELQKFFRRFEGRPPLPFEGRRDPGRPRPPFGDRPLVPPPQPPEGSAQ